MNEDPRNAVSIHLWASLVPAAAVIPAQVAYFDVVAVKKLGVGWHPRPCPCPKPRVGSSPRGGSRCRLEVPPWSWPCPLPAPPVAWAAGGRGARGKFPDNGGRPLLSLPPPVVFFAREWEKWRGGAGTWGFQWERFFEEQGAALGTIPPQRLEQGLPSSGDSWIRGSLGAPSLQRVFLSACGLHPETLRRGREVGTQRASLLPPFAGAVGDSGGWSCRPRETPTGLVP